MVAGTVHRADLAHVRAAVLAWWCGGGGRELVRYAGIGVLCSVVYSVLFVALDDLGPLLANLLASVVGTVLGTELHRRLTFRVARRVDWVTAQWQSAGVAVLGLGVTTAVLAAVPRLVPGTAWWQQVLLVNAATALIGVGRYLVLRTWVFRAR